MRRLTVLAATAAAIFWGATRAEAQIIIDPAGPLCIAVGNQTTTYTATVTTNYSFYLELQVYDGQTLLSDTTDFISQSGPTYNYSKTLNCSAWAIRQGDTLNYHAIGTIANGPYRGTKTTADWHVTVGAPGTCHLHRHPHKHQASHADAARREDLHRWRNV